MTARENDATGLEFDTGDGDIDYPPPDDLFKALASDTRRRLLAALPADSAMTLDELTDVLVGWQSTADGPAGPDEWAKVKIELVHAHIPLLVDAGLVTCDDEEIARATYPEPVMELVTFAGEYETAIGERDPR
ncbi:winged helix-turn-helix domain-containing protein [Haloarcula onubensis]|uniref:Helix-turn-helix domain-containing protein n=1 Tax=Haloarcula onubensis TaxID=2950539 RepID=A0ABU2FMM9_9EURY|nr:helix-turn-helix domain-containing protein [Halomicroarcula sp. S3CR25-11]MDS0282009.1 helix-turn-helix domain-containing protein [Halomicroarcula sp. S3CR25-11]